MFEVDGFVPAVDPRIARFRTLAGAAQHRLAPLGGYAVPLSTAQLRSGAAQG
jgi:hypothetical protein